MASFKVESQFPRPRIEVIKPDGAVVELNPNYAGLSAGGGSIVSRNLLSYTFSEAVDDLMGSFSFSVENEMIAVGNNGKSLFDLIPLRSVVNIYEADEKTPAFRGIIRKRHIGATMTSNGVKKSVVFSGKSVISCVTEFMVPLDIRIPEVSGSIGKTKTLQSKLSKDSMPIVEFMTESWNYFREVSDEVSKSSGFVNGRLLEIIDKYIGTDFIQATGKETSLQYPVATMFYNQTNNYITDVWSNILPKPVYELFARFDVEAEKPAPVIVARQVPYGDPDNGNNDWLDLNPLYSIDPVMLVGYDLEQSDEDVYTAFNSYVIGSPKSKEFYQAVSGKVDTYAAMDAEKSAIYGFRLLSVSFTGFDRMTNDDDEPDNRADKLGKALETLNKRIRYWYSRVDEMYSGTINLITNFKDISKNPKAGFRVSFLGGQFYVEKSVHSWNYGGAPLNVLTVSRGMVYDDNGKILKIMPEIGKLYGELEG
ncbi:MAG: hypothetical protein LBK73_03525 [Treponema sp.]|nr:hypothetical protein [Treponema sp.]